MNFDADRPIETGDEDRLQRQPFAESIARQILSIPAERGFTVAVSGEWGTGKTSVVNLVTEILENERSAPVLFRFNPWLFSGTRELVRRFFRELGAQIGLRDLSGLKEVSKAVLELGEELAPISPVPGTGLILRLARRVIQKTASPKSLLHQRDALKKALLKSESRVIVIIDDIDRLEPIETREVMRLVRLLSDLPNLVFLLIYDRDRVAQSLDEVPEVGRGYLEKIVQLTFDMPSVRRKVLQELFRVGLQELIEDHHLDPPTEQVRFPVFFDVVSPLLRSLRDVKRLH